MRSKLLRFSRITFGLALATGLLAVGLAGATSGASARSSASVEVTFTKWVTDYPNMAGFVGGDLGAGVFAGEIISRNPNVANGRFTKVEALYQVRGGGSAFDAHSEGAASAFDALLEVWQDNKKGSAVFNGFVVSGWLAGERVTGGFKIITCKEAANGTCFQGTIRINREALD